MEVEVGGGGEETLIDRNISAAWADISPLGRVPICPCAGAVVADEENPKRSSSSGNKTSGEGAEGGRCCACNDPAVDGRDGANSLAPAAKPLLPPAIGDNEVDRLAEMGMNSLTVRPGGGRIVPEPLDCPSMCELGSGCRLQVHDQENNSLSKVDSCTHGHSYSLVYFFYSRISNSWSHFCRLGATCWLSPRRPKSGLNLLT